MDSKLNKAVWETTTNATASLPFSFWPWKWYPSHVPRGLPLCEF